MTVAYTTKMYYASGSIAEAFVFQSSRDTAN